MAFNPNDHLIKLKGRDYLPVQWRLVWFREDFPESTIETELIQIDGTGATERAIFKATIVAHKDGSIVRNATGYGSETRNDFGDFIEKAETKAIGRALVAIGYGTQFAPELDEGDRVVDSPIQPKTSAQKPVQRAERASTPKRTPATEAAFKRIHALLAEQGLEHDHLTAYAAKSGYESSKELSMEELTQMATGLKDNTATAVKYLKKLHADWEMEQINAEVSKQFDEQQAGLSTEEVRV